MKNSLLQTIKMGNRKPNKGGSPWLNIQKKMAVQNKRVKAVKEIKLQDLQTEAMDTIK